MPRSVARSLAAVLSLLLVLAGTAAVVADPPLPAVHGVLDKAGSRDSLVIKPRAADGRFEKAVTYKLTGTSRLTIVAPQQREGKTVLTQREVNATELLSGQSVALIYAEVAGGPVVLTL